MGVPIIWREVLMVVSRSLVSRRRHFALSLLVALPCAFILISPSKYLLQAMIPISQQCGHPECSKKKRSKAQPFCTNHGGGVACLVFNCKTAAQAGGKCYIHTEKIADTGVDGPSRSQRVRTLQFIMLKESKDLVSKYVEPLCKNL